MYVVSPIKCASAFVYVCENQSFFPKKLPTVLHAKMFVFTFVIQMFYFYLNIINSQLVMCVCVCVQ